MLNKEYHLENKKKVFFLLFSRIFLFYLTKALKYILDDATCGFSIEMHKKKCSVTTEFRNKSGQTAGSQRHTTFAAASIKETFSSY